MEKILKFDKRRALLGLEKNPKLINIGPTVKSQAVDCLG